jgi:hypothetical protein
MYPAQELAFDRYVICIARAMSHWHNRIFDYIYYYLGSIPRNFIAKG